MATYKDDLDILKAAEKADTNKLTFNAITELDNKGLLPRYGNEGGGGGSDIYWVSVTEDGDSYTMDKTYAEIVAAFQTKLVCLLMNGTLYICGKVGTKGNNLEMNGFDGGSVNFMLFTANTENDYPSWTDK